MDPGPRRTAWISRGLEALIADPELQAPAGSAVDFDVVIVGSGYGGAIAAQALAGCVDRDTGLPLRVCVLERGREYLAGSFPAGMAELPRQLRWASPGAWRAGGTSTGLFDLRLGADASALVANGVGGGSLINAGVMAEPHASVFDEGPWPAALRDPDERLRRYQAMRDTLGATAHAAKRPKAEALRAVAGAAKPLHITVAASTGPNAAGVVLDACIACGDCFTGCNHNAKHSLDLGLLRQAERQGVLVISGATVMRLHRDDAADATNAANAANPANPADSAVAAAPWQLDVVHTEMRLRERQGPPLVLRARRVVLAAGTFGSTEILLRSRSQKLAFSSHLGRGVSTNGDMIATLHDIAAPVNAAGREQQPPAQRGVGPTITTMADMRTGDRRHDLVVQDLAVPAPLRRLFEEAVTTTDVLNRLVDGDPEPHASGDAPPDSAAVDPKAIDHSLLIAMMGRDDALGRLVESDGADPLGGDGLLTIDWPGLRDDVRWDDWHRRVRTLLAGSGQGGRMLDNPMWRPLSEEMERVFGRQRGPLMTVHPLGGCRLGPDRKAGVARADGAVFNGDPKAKDDAVHEGLYVLDGSIVPTSLGINPALTIAVLARLATEAWTEGPQRWCERPPAAAEAEAEAKPEPVRRPIYRVPETLLQPQPTRIEVSEQLRGEMWLALGGQPRRRYWVELTLVSAPTPVADLVAREAPERGLLLAPGQGRLRILSRAPDPVTDRADPAAVVLEARVGGRLRLFRHAPTHPFGRALMAGWAWLRNRGLNDIARSLIESRLVRRQWQPPPDLPPALRCTQVHQMWRLLKLAGTVRLLEYELTLDAVLGGTLDEASQAALRGAEIRGQKRLTYTRCASPWGQLMEVTPTRFPGWQANRDATARWTLNPRYLARRVVPLLRVVDQQDRAAALVDLVSFVLYSLRLVLQVHALSFRQPDAPLVQPAHRLPGLLPGLPAPAVTELDVQAADVPRPGRHDQRHPQPARIRLTRYRPNGAALKEKVPVLAIHGYSASGTTFAHPEVPNGLVPTLLAHGRDCWVLDMRSSAGMPTAREGWAFETMAEHDIPAAVAHVRAATGAAKVDIVAHCMGAVMCSMALLHEPAGGATNPLHESVRRLVLSQAGPLLLMSPENILRAYVMRYVREFLPLGDYSFSPQGERTLADRLFDRLLATVPVPPEEYKLEHPWWPLAQATPWAGSRRRMDALYARTFALANLSPQLLARFDDHFGPLSVETVSQVIHFARFATATDRQGFNRYVVPRRMLERFDFPVFALHGEHNGLTSPATLQLLRQAIDAAHGKLLNDDQPGADGTWMAQPAATIDAAIRQHRHVIERGRRCLLTWRIAGHGHQDVLIGRQAGVHCARIADFLA